MRINLFRYLSLDTISTRIIINWQIEKFNVKLVRLTVVQDQCTTKMNLHLYYVHLLIVIRCDIFSPALSYSIVHGKSPLYLLIIVIEVTL